ncbi:MAG: hypothetical protein VX000_12190, partial [Myxococcota bacterium]|nr:hypothetical protein [Myxococcota bacterium]
AAAAEERARAADDRAKVALNRVREALDSPSLAAPPASASSGPPAAPQASESLVVGPEGEVVVDGESYRVDPVHAGKAYEVRGTRSRRVRIGGRFVRKSRA